MFENQYNYNVGSINDQPNNSYSNSTFLTEDEYENDIYSFSVEENSNLNLSVNNISEGDDADLELYQDNNNNGELDENDSLIDGSYNLHNADDSIDNINLEPGNYFARVSLFEGSDDGQLNYDFNLSANSDTPEEDNNLGELSGDESREGFVSETEQSDVYQFSLGLNSGVDITLEGLSNDADLYLYQDNNNNGQIEGTDEIVNMSINLGSSDEFIATDLSGDYLLEVAQYSGETSYEVNFDQYEIAYA